MDSQVKIWSVDLDGGPTEGDRRVEDAVKVIKVIRRDGTRGLGKAQ